MPATPLQHFREDIGRARSLVVHADALPRSTPSEAMLRGDVLRSAWMFAVGALDAYFRDAYTDIVAATIIAKSRHAPMALPPFFASIRFPVGSILETYASSPNWRWRMAARRMMEKESVLGLDAIRRLFNPFFRKGRRFFGDLIGDWIVHPIANRRLFRLTGDVYLALDPAGRDRARWVAKEQLEARVAGIIQRRHDCIHNCDRPKVAPQTMIKAKVVQKVIDDVDFLVDRSDEHINAEFRLFLTGAGCPASVVRAAGY